MKYPLYYILILLLSTSYGLEIEAAKPTTTTVTVTVTVSPTETTTSSKTSTSKTTSSKTTTSKTKTSKSTSITKTTLTTKTTSSKTSEPCAPTAPAGTQSLYGQCGGLNYCGPTNCPKGAYCRDGLLDDNPFYSQCVASTTKASDPVVTSTVITTVTVKPPTSGITYITVTMTITAA